jgi:hypothetical protein
VVVRDAMVKEKKEKKNAEMWLQNALMTLITQVLKSDSPICRG